MFCFTRVRAALLLRPPAFARAERAVRGSLQYIIQKRFQYYTFVEVFIVDPFHTALIHIPCTLDQYLKVSGVIVNIIVKLCPSKQYRHLKCYHFHVSKNPTHSFLGIHPKHPAQEPKALDLQADIVRRTSLYGTAAARRCLKPVST